MEPLELCDAMIKGIHLYYNNKECLVLAYSNGNIELLICSEVDDQLIKNNAETRDKFSREMKSAWDDLPENDKPDSWRVKDLERWLNKYEQDIKEISLR